MKTKKRNRVVILGVFLAASTLLLAQKKTHTFTTERIIPASAERVWDVVGTQFGSIANYHGGIVSSDLINGSTKAEVGCERVCALNEEGSRYLEEKLTSFSDEEMEFKVQVLRGAGVPTVPEYTHAIYKVERIDEVTSKLVVTNQYRTKPALIGLLAKGTFKKLTNEQLAFIEHYTLTGEAVNADNKKEIRAKYGL